MNKLILKKEKGLNYTYDEINNIVNLYIKNKINDEQMSKFIFDIYKYGMSLDEMVCLTDVMIKSGEVIDLSEVSNPLVDKHSSGGIGDKITLIISPIVASLDVCVPKMSGRGLGITGGTADKLESIPGYKLNLSKKEFISALENVGCAVISQSDKIALADKKIYALRNEIGAVDSIPLIASSIMSKKIASGANSIIIDLKVGSGAFVKNIKEGIKLSKTMNEIGKRYNKSVICTLSDMSNPLGTHIGNALEVVEAINFFDGKYDKRLYSLVVYLSSLMVSIGKKIKFSKAKLLVLETIKNKNAKIKFYEWIKNQNGDISKFKISAKKYIVLSNKTGYVNSIDASKIGKLVFDLGAGRVKKTDKIDYNVGFVINKTIGSKVTKGDFLGVVYYNKYLPKNIDDLVNDSFNINKKKKRAHNIVIKTIK